MHLDLPSKGLSRNNFTSFSVIKNVLKGSNKFKVKCFYADTAHTSALSFEAPGEDLSCSVTLYDRVLEKVTAPISLTVAF